MNSYYAWINDEMVLMQSASGGIFTALSRYILKHKGVVFGARMDLDTYDVSHSMAKLEDDLAELRGSKYQQSSIQKTYNEVVEKLMEGIPVLFSGTPCQIAALHRYLTVKKINQELLLCVEVLCHGVTSAKVVRSYVRSKEKQRHRKIRELYFRTKDRPWYYGSSMKLVYRNGREEVRDNLIDPFYIAYVNSLILRPSCYACPFAKKEGRMADFTIGDFWGAEEYIQDKKQLRKGVGLVLTNTEKGESVWHELIDAQIVQAAELDFEKARKRNGALVKPVKKNPNRERFFSRLDKKDFADIVQSIYSKKSLKNWIRYMIGYDNMRRINSIKCKFRGK